MRFPIHISQPEANGRATQIALATIGLIVALLARWAMDPLLGDRVAFVTMYAAVALGVWIAGWKVATLIAALGFFAVNFWFIEPRGELGIVHPREAAAINAGYVVAATVIILLGGLMHGWRQRGVEAARLRERDREAHAIDSASEVTRQREAEAQRQWNVQLTALLSRTATRLLEDSDPQRVVEDCCREVLAFLDCQAFFNYLFDAAADRLRLNAYAGIPAEEAKRIEWLDFGQAVCGCVARDRQRIVAEQIPDTPDSRTELVKSYGIRAYCCHPLTVQGRLIGTLSFGTSTRDRFTEAETGAMKAVTDLVAIAMNRIQTEQSLRESEDRFRRSAETFASLVNQSPLGVYTVDSNFRIRHVSAGSIPAFRNVQPVIGRDFAEVMRIIWPQALAEEVIAIFRRVLETGEPYISPGLTEKRQDTGHIESYEWQVNRVLLDDGRHGAVCYFFDTTRIQQVQEALRQSEKRFREMIDSLPTPVYTTDAEGRITHYNPACVEFSGRSPELNSDRWCVSWKLFHPDGTPMPHEECPMAVTLKSAKPVRGVEAIIERPDGVRRWFEPFPTPLCDEEGKLVGGINMIVDITERKQAEQALRDQARTLETLNRIGSALSAELETRKILQTVTDAATELSGARYGAFFFNAVSESGESYLLYTLSGAPREAFERFGTPRNTPVFRPTFSGARALRSDDITRDPRYGQMGPHHGMPMGHLPVHSYLAVPVVSRAGSVLGGLFFGHPEVGVFTEESERLISGLAAFAAIALDNAQLYEAARESEQRFRMVADNMAQLAWTCDKLGNVTWYNQRWLEYTGMSFEEMKGWDWSKVQHPEHLDRVVERVKLSAETGEPWEDTFPLRGKDGEYRWFLSRAYPIRDAQGEVVHWFGTNTDVTAQREAEQQLREAMTELQRASLMKDEFLATLSHELRTPMNSILGWAQLLKHPSFQQSPEQVAEGIDVIERNARLQGQIIEDLLDMSRIISGKIRLNIQSVKLGEIVGAAVDSIRPTAAAKQVRLENICDPNVSDVRGDAARLQQVIYNLLTNAVKFTPKDGKVQICCQRVNSHIEISVSDTGAGISAEFLPFVFERFRQQDGSIGRKHSGLGLGLSIAKQIVEMHGGKIQASSGGEDQGATFTVHLPVAIAIRPEMPAGALDRRHPALGTYGGVMASDIDTSRLRGRRILVVEDERDARTLLCTVLRERGMECHQAGTGDEALTLLKSGVRPDLIISDLGMPGLNGYDLMAAIRKLPPSQGGATPAIALTAYARAEDRTRSLLAGYQLHLSKPVELNEFLAAAVRLLA